MHNSILLSKNVDTFSGGKLNNLWKYIKFSFDINNSYIGGNYNIMFLLYKLNMYQTTDGSGENLFDNYFNIIDNKYFDNCLDLDVSNYDIIAYYDEISIDQYCTFYSEVEVNINSIVVRYSEYGSRYLWSSDYHISLKVEVSCDDVLYYHIGNILLDYNNLDTDVNFTLNSEKFIQVGYNSSYSVVSDFWYNNKTVLIIDTDGENNEPVMNKSKITDNTENITNVNSHHEHRCTRLFEHTNSAITFNNRTGSYIFDTNTSTFFTFETYIYVDSFHSINSEYIIFGIANAPDEYPTDIQPKDYMKWGLVINGSGNLCLINPIDGTYRYEITSQSIELHEWYHVAVTVRHFETYWSEYIFINGNLVTVVNNMSYGGIWWTASNLESVFTTRNNNITDIIYLTYWVCRYEHTTVTSTVGFPIQNYDYPISYPSVIKSPNLFGGIDFSVDYIVSGYDTNSIAEIASFTTLQYIDFGRYIVCGTDESTIARYTSKLYNLPNISGDWSIFTEMYINMLPDNTSNLTIFAISDSSSETVLEMIYTSSNTVKINLTDDSNSVIVLESYALPTTTQQWVKLLLSYISDDDKIYLQIYETLDGTDLSLNEDRIIGTPGTHSFPPSSSSEKYTLTLGGNNVNANIHIGGFLFKHELLYYDSVEKSTYPFSRQRRLSNQFLTNKYYNINGIDEYTLDHLPRIMLYDSYQDPRLWDKRYNGNYNCKLNDDNNYNNLFYSVDNTEFFTDYSYGFNSIVYIGGTDGVSPEYFTVSNNSSPDSVLYGFKKQTKWSIHFWCYFDYIYSPTSTYPLYIWYGDVDNYIQIFKTTSYYIKYRFNGYDRNTNVGGISSSVWNKIDILFDSGTFTSYINDSYVATATHSSMSYYNNNVGQFMKMDDRRYCRIACVHIRLGSSDMELNPRNYELPDLDYKFRFIRILLYNGYSVGDVDYMRLGTLFVHDKPIESMNTIINADEETDVDNNNNIYGKLITYYESEPLTSSISYGTGGITKYSDTYQTQFYWYSNNYNFSGYCQLTIDLEEKIDVAAMYIKLMSIYSNSSIGYLNAPLYILGSNTNSPNDYNWFPISVIPSEGYRNIASSSDWSFLFGYYQHDVTIRNYYKQNNIRTAYVNNLFYIELKSIDFYVNSVDISEVPWANTSVTDDLTDIYIEGTPTGTGTFTIYTDVGNISVIVWPQSEVNGLTVPDNIDVYIPDTGWFTVGDVFINISTTVYSNNKHGHLTYYCTNRKYKDFIRVNKTGDIFITNNFSWGTNNSYDIYIDVLSSYNYKKQTKLRLIKEYLTYPVSEQIYNIDTNSGLSWDENGPEVVGYPAYISAKNEDGDSSKGSTTIIYPMGTIFNEPTDDISIAAHNSPYFSNGDSGYGIWWYDPDTMYGRTGNGSNLGNEVGMGYWMYLQATRNLDGKKSKPVPIHITVPNDLTDFTPKFTTLEETIQINEYPLCSKGDIIYEFISGVNVVFNIGNVADPIYRIFSATYPISDPTDPTDHIFIMRDNKLCINLPEQLNLSGGYAHVDLYIQVQHGRLYSNYFKKLSIDVI